MPGADGSSFAAAFAPQHTAVPTPQLRAPENCSARGTHRHALERLRLLCSIGLDAAVLLPELFLDLRSVIPALAATVIWSSDTHGTRIATESDDHFALSKHAQRPPRLWQHVQARSGACRVLAGVDAHVREALFAHDPQFLRHVVDHTAVTVSLGVAHPVMGCVALYRSTPGTPFSAHEHALLVSLAPVLAAALQVENAPTDAFTVAAHRGTLLLDDAARIVHVCAHAQRIMCLANLDAPDVPPALGAIGRQFITSPAELRAGGVATREHVNTGGRFVFQTQRLKSMVNGACLGGAMLTVTHHLPLALNVLRQCERLALPPECVARNAHVHEP